MEEKRYYHHVIFYHHCSTINPFHVSVDVSFFLFVCLFDSFFICFFFFLFCRSFDDCIVFIICVSWILNCAACQ